MEGSGASAYTPSKRRATEGYASSHQIYAHTASCPLARRTSHMTHTCLYTNFLEFRRRKTTQWRPLSTIRFRVPGAGQHLGHQHVALLRVFTEQKEGGTILDTPIHSLSANMWPTWSEDGGCVSRAEKMRACTTRSHNIRYTRRTQLAHTRVMLENTLRYTCALTLLPSSAKYSANHRNTRLIGRAPPATLGQVQHWQN